GSGGPRRGLGSGAPFLGGLPRLVVVTPPEHRAAVVPAFSVVASASLSVPAVIAGIVVTHLGLDTTFEVFGAVVAGIALIVAGEAWRTRPAPAPPGAGGAPTPSARPPAPRASSPPP